MHLLASQTKDSGLFPNSNFNIYKFHNYCMHASDTVSWRKVFFGILDVNILSLITDHGKFEEHTWTTLKTTYFQGVVIKSSGWLLLKSFTTYEKNPYERACRIVSETSANLLNGIERLNSSLLNWTILL